MNFVSLKAFEEAPYGARARQEVEDAEVSVCSFCRLRSDQLDRLCLTAAQADNCEWTQRQERRAFVRRHLHSLFRETLTHYRDPTSDWARRASHSTLKNIWENYRNA